MEARSVAGWILAGACRYYEFRVVDLDVRADRARIAVETVAAGRIRDFLGFNRARHAVVEAAILATRVSILPRAEILAELGRLAVLVSKTGGAVEEKAFRLLHEYVLNAPEQPPRTWPRHAHDCDFASALQAASTSACWAGDLRHRGNSEAWG